MAPPARMRVAIGHRRCHMRSPDAERIGYHRRPPAIDYHTVGGIGHVHPGGWRRGPDGSIIVHGPSPSDSRYMAAVRLSAEHLRFPPSWHEYIVAVDKDSIDRAPNKSTHWKYRILKCEH
jgi:hypothetical protein